jgi:hypothetical protein
VTVRGSLRKIGTSLLRTAARSARSAEPATPRPAARSFARRAYPGDFHGDVEPEYAPRADGEADPGEVVWAWVPYEEDHTRGKDRPVLVVGHDGPLLLALMLTSKDHDRHAADEARWGRRWMDVGTGAWDRQRRPSEVRLDRVLRLDVGSVRREGCRLDRATFDLVVQELARLRRSGDRRGP